MSKLTRKAFRAWLASKPRRRFERTDLNWGGMCPLHEYRGLSRDGHARRWPKWAHSFAADVDRNVGIGTRITAAKCLRILDGIK